jgi:hypothetical protein
MNANVALPPTITPYSAACYSDAHPPSMEEINSFENVGVFTFVIGAQSIKFHLVSCFAVTLKS